MIERVRALCRDDERVVAAMMYGSFTLGEGDRYSDIEFMLFIRDEALPELDPAAWLSHVAPVELSFVNEHGVVAAIFSNLVRGEFHFDRASEIRAKLPPSLRPFAWFPSLESTLLVDRTGELAACLQALVGPAPERGGPQETASICHNLINGWFFGWNTLQRGELARALELLWMVQRNLLHLARLQERAIQHWPTPSRRLEQDLSPEGYRRYAACTAALDRAQLERAYRAAWQWARELMAALAPREGVALPEGLLAKLDARARCGTADERGSTQIGDE